MRLKHKDAAVNPAMPWCEIRNMQRTLLFACFSLVRAHLGEDCQRQKLITKGSLAYLSSMYFSTSLVLGEVAGPYIYIYIYTYTYTFC